MLDYKNPKLDEATRTQLFRLYVENMEKSFSAELADMSARLKNLEDRKISEELDILMAGKKDAEKRLLKLENPQKICFLKKDLKKN